MCDSPGTKPTTQEGGGPAPKKVPFFAKWEVGTWKDLMAGIQSVATVIALLAGGWWTYQIFVLERETSPHANVTQVVTGKLISQKWYWIQISITAQNTGKSLVQFDDADIRVQQINPVPSNVEESIKNKKDPVEIPDLYIPWKGLCRYFRPYSIKLEAGESDTTEVEFLIPAWLKTVRIYTYLENTTDYSGWLFWRKSNNYGWHTVTLYDLKGSTEDEGQAMAKLLPNNDRVCAYDESLVGGGGIGSRAP
jgi:hypothetical protein